MSTWHEDLGKVIAELRTVKVTGKHDRRTIDRAIERLETLRGRGPSLFDLPPGTPPAPRAEISVDDIDRVLADPVLGPLARRDAEDVIAVYRQRVSAETFAAMSLSAPRDCAKRYIDRLPRAR